MWDRHGPYAGKGLQHMEQTRLSALAVCHAAMEKAYPKLSFRKVGVNLASGDPKTYMDPLIEATKDIEVTLVFNNAGFITTGFYSDVPLGRSMANYHW